MRHLAWALLLFALPAVAKDKHAPLPSAITSAKTVFLLNAGTQDSAIKDDGAGAFDDMYSAFSEWSRFKIVDSPEKADLVIEISYQSIAAGTHVWSSTNTYTGQTSVYSSNAHDPVLTMAIFNPKHELLWSASRHRELARREKNRQKNLAKTVADLVSDFKSRFD